jgi:subtilase family serine protease
MRRATRRMIYLLAGGAVTAAVVVAAVAPAGASTARVRVGSTTPLPAGARVTGTTPASTSLRLTIALQPQDPAALASYATAVSTPGSSLFRHYLTVAQFSDRFGATDAHIAAVESALRAAGLHVGAVTANKLTIPVTGSAAQVESAFSVSLAQVTLPSGRVAHANQQAPALPATIAGDVQGVIGLGDVTLDQPQDIRAPHRARRAAGAIRPHAVGNGPAPCSDATTTSRDFGGYTADEIAGAYGLNSDYVAGDEGAGQTVGVFEEEAYQPSDLTTFQSCYGTSASVSNVDVDGGPGAYNSSIGDDEAALDIDQVIGLAPKANILVYQGPPTATSPADILTAMVSQNRAKVLSSSWGVCEDLTDPAVISSENTTLQEAAAQGQSFFISSGDSGSTDCYQATREDNTPDFDLSVIDPGGQPFATAVGGTFLGTAAGDLPTDGSYPGEFVWNDGFDSVSGRASASGGGVSDQWQMPSYQTSASESLHVISSNSSRSCGGQLCRQVPDVSADADPFSGYVIFANGGTATGGWEVIGGTSASAPFWAAFTALANASAACRGVTLGFENPALYQIAGSSYTANFHDVTASDASPNSGEADNNAFFGFTNPANPDGLYPLANGYDMATGLGTPIGNVLGPSLCKVRAPIFTVTVANPGAQTSTAGKPVALTIHATDSGSKPLAYTASGLPSGLTINAATGVISGTPTTPGTFTVTVSAGDQFANSGRTTFGWSVVKPPPGPPSLSKLGFGNVGKGKAKVSFTLHQGSNAPAIKSFSVSLPKGLAFAKKTKTLTKHISLKGAKYSLKLSRGVLTITLKNATSKVTFSIGPPATVVSKSLKHKVHTHKVKSLSIGVKVLDARGHATKLTVKHNV